ncbi:uncharacterized protein BYT42DRAFT_345856 [Radiomyces spectabilis]|uniref:uncharacterized protein n=1 Tax=Radiomyces spectabilis TaxID=64574 RepID=UPI00221F6C8B|nr:uncharacterized protein BYT42DRAFT_345856 [Radiomyces spectabilis]KAI8377478.1 hypothetical protein BYT42DRAFT_345856 [Radiomyces spectabilis]
MLSCIQAGATDYLLKPLRLDVIKPLFLKIHRYRHDSKTHNSSLPSSPISCPDHYISNSIPRSAAMTATPSMTNTTSSSTITGSITTLCDNVTHRIKDIFHKDIQFTQAVMDIYVPTRLPNHHMRLTTENTARLKAKVSSWDFSPFDFDHEELIHIVYIIFNEILSTKELSHITITEGQLYDFIIDLSNTYRDENPYHNFAHAVDVLQCIYYFISQLGVLDHPSMETDPILPHHLLRPKDVFALFIAAIGHDAAHPGVNNMFLINSATPLAMLYNDRSVLESLHSMTLFHIMKRHHLDQIVGGAGSTDYQEFRKTVVTSVLATDMSLHNDYVCKIKDQAVRLREADLKTMDATARENERLLLCSALIKCADISNVTRPFRRGAKWAELLVQEFLSQGDLEKELGMPVLPMNDRDKVVLEESQIGFIRFVALDLFQSIRDVIPPISFAVDYMQDNLKRWENLKNTKTRDTLSVKEDVNIELRIGK